MITTINRRKVTVDFKYSGTLTACYLTDVKGKTLATASVSRDSRDNDNRIVARKAALTKAIASYPRNVRAKIWKDLKEQMRYKTR